MWTMSSEIKWCVWRRSTIEHWLPKLQPNHLGDLSTIRWSMWSKCYQFGTNDLFFPLSSSILVIALQIFRTVFLFLLLIWSLFFWLYLFLFRIIYQFWIFMQFHPPLIFSVVRFGPCSFDCYFFEMVLKLNFFFTISSSYSLFFLIKFDPYFYFYFCFALGIF